MGAQQAQWRHRLQHTGVRAKSSVKSGRAVRRPVCRRVGRSSSVVPSRRVVEHPCGDLGRPEVGSHWAWRFSANGMLAHCIVYAAGRAFMCAEGG